MHCLLFPIQWYINGLYSKHTQRIGAIPDLRLELAHNLMCNGGLQSLLGAPGGVFLLYLVVEGFTASLWGLEAFKQMIVVLMELTGI